MTGHSLGGALASLCAFDVAECLTNPRVEKGVTPRPGRSQASVATYGSTLASMKAFRSSMKGQPTVPVTAVTFAAPRVGDVKYAMKFGEARCVYMRCVDHGVHRSMDVRSMHVNTVRLQSV